MLQGHRRLQENAPAKPNDTCVLACGLGFRSHVGLRQTNKIDMVLCKNGSNDGLNPKLLGSWAQVKRGLNG